MVASVRRVFGILSTTCALGAIGAVALPVAAAQANLVNFNTCNTSALSQPFAQWGDPASYELAPGGDFESSTWTLHNGAQLVSGSEPFAATGTLGSSSLSLSLSLPAGAWAQSPLTCMTADYPTLRFFIAGSGMVLVQIVDGNMSIPTGVAVASGGWQPTPVILTGSLLTGLLSGGTAQVSVRLTAISGNPQVDDVFIDPWHRG
jgi:hypothetical protein